MPRGLSWQQEGILVSLAVQRKLGGPDNDAIPIVWFKNGPHSWHYTLSGLDDETSERRLALTVRRSIAGLEKRGLVTVRPIKFHSKHYAESSPLPNMRMVHMRIRDLTRPRERFERYLMAAALTDEGLAFLTRDHPSNTFPARIEEKIAREQWPSVD